MRRLGGPSGALTPRGLTDYLAGGARVGERNCVEPGCHRRVIARGWCQNHYGKRWRLGLVQPELPLNRHILTNVDSDRLVADCTICGPAATIRMRDRGRSTGPRPECRGSRSREARGSEERRGYRLRSKYGLDVAAVERMTKVQSGRCLICGTTPGQLVVDHCHVTGKVRGLLCRNCNIGLGFLQDDPQLARRAADYLDAHRP